MKKENRMKAAIPSLIATAAAWAALAMPSIAQEDIPPSEALSDAYQGKSYSPYANRGFPSRPYWGDSHLHTGLSLDAGAFGARLDPRDAHRFARFVASTSTDQAGDPRPLRTAQVTESV
jgi:hypothetical protein